MRDHLWDPPDQIKIGLPNYLSDQVGPNPITQGIRLKDLLRLKKRILHSGNIRYFINISYN